MKFHIFTTIILLWIPEATPFPSGAPDDATVCTDLNPYGHAAPENSGTPPFEIQVSSTNYSANSQIDVTISSLSAVPFKGFILQARRSDAGANQNEAVGTFDVTNEPDAQATCATEMGQDSAVTHVGPTNKTSISVVWSAPSTSQGNLVFRATIVEVYDSSSALSRYWENVLSPNISGSQPPTQTTTDDVTGSTISTIPTTTADVIGSTISPISDTECGIDKGCYRDPPECTETDCKYFLTWKVNGDDVDFELSSQTTDINSWAAVGFSLDQNMGDDSVNDCIYDSATGMTKVEASWNDNSPNNEVLDNPNLGLEPSNSVAASMDGRIQCSFTRAIHVTNVTGDDVGKMFNLSQSYYLFLGRGPASSGKVSYHPEFPIISPQMVDVSDAANYVDIGGTPRNVLVITHGALMIFAWLVFVNVGVLLPRYYKTAWPGEELCGKQVWFQLHRPIMVLAATLTIIAFIIIFVEVGGYASTLVGADAVHPITGIIVTALAIANPIMAVLRPHPGTPKRFIFNWAHFGVGTCAQVLAAVTVFLGTRLAKAKMSDWAQWVVLGCIGWHAFIEFILASHQMYIGYYVKRSGNHDLPMRGVDEMRRKSDDIPDLASSNKMKEDGIDNVTVFKTLILVVHFIGLSLFAIALVMNLAR